jgi:hypothetical protein
MRGRPATAATLHRAARISWYVLTAGTLGLMVVAAIVRPEISSRGGPILPPVVTGTIAWLSFATATMALLASRVLPGRMVRSGPTIESIASMRSGNAIGISGAVGLLSPLFWMVSGRPVALAAVAIALLALVLAMPSRRRWGELLREVEASAGPEPGATVVLRPVVMPSRLEIALFSGELAMGVFVLVLATAFWRIFVLGTSSGSLVLALLILSLGLGITCQAGLRLLRARTSRHPRLQRAYGILLLAFVIFYFFAAVRMR